MKINNKTYNSPLDGGSEVTQDGMAGTVTALEGVGNMLVKFRSFEFEVSRRGAFFGVNLGRRRRFQAFKDFTGQGLSATDWIVRPALG